MGGPLFRIMGLWGRQTGWLLAGLGVSLAALILNLADAALARGEVPFLHVFPDNPARDVYTRLGFRLRATLRVVWRRPIA